MKNNKHIRKSDYSKADLPSTRTEQFFRILRDNYLTFIKIGIMLVILMLPFVLAFMIKNISISNILKNEAIPETDKTSNIIVINIIFGGVYLPCIMFFFLGFAGILKILRRLIWDEPLFFKEDFFLGIKESYGSFLLYGFLIGLISFFCVLTHNLFGGYLKYVSYILTAISFAIVIPIVLIATYASSIYNSKINVSFSVSGNLFIRRGIFTILILLILYSAYFLPLLPIPLTFLIAIILVLIIFLFPVWILLSYINCIKAFDDFINITQYPDKAYLGLFVNAEYLKKISEKRKNNKP